MIISKLTITPTVRRTCTILNDVSPKQAGNIIKQALNLPHDKTACYHHILNNRIKIQQLPEKIITKN